MSDESIKPPATLNKTLNPLLNYVGTKARVKFSRDEKIVNIYIVYEKVST